MKIKNCLYCFVLFFAILTGCEQGGNALPPSPSAVPTEVPISSPEPEEREEPQTLPPTPSPTPKPKPVLLGSAQTKILDFQESRIHNIRLSIQKINGYILAPGQKFSFNTVVGPRTADVGYQKATVLMHGEKTQDYGGGVCQVSTTLFQAARAAGFTIAERHSHQKDVGYAHPGEDAAVDYGNKDMCFINNTSKNVVIEASVGNGVVSVSIR